MELPKIKILDEKNKVLRKVSKEVTFPLDEIDRKKIEEMYREICNQAYSDEGDTNND